MRKVILVIAIAVAVAIGFSLSTLRATVGRGAEELAAALAERSTRTVSVGEVSLSLFPLPVASVNGIKVETVPMRGDEPRPILDIPRLEVHPKILPLLIGRVSVHSVEAVEAVVHAYRERGKKKFDALIPEGTGAKLSALGFPIKFTDSAFHYWDGGRPQVVAIDVADANLVIGGRRNSQLIDIVGTASVLGANSDSTIALELEPDAGPTGGHRVEGKLDLTAVDLDAIKSALPLLKDLPLSGEPDMALTIEGFAGEVTTESAPAEPLKINLATTMGFELFGRTEDLSVEGVIAFDDRSVQVRNGELEWAGITGRIGGWMRDVGRNLSGRLSIDRVDVGALMGEYGIDDVWHPELVIGGSIKLSGHEMEPLLNYEASAESVRFAPYEGYEIVAGPTTFRGSLLASNAVFSISVVATEFSVGEIKILEDPSFGSRWFRDKLTVTSLNLPLWDGKSHSSIIHIPKQQKDVELGGMVEDASAAAFIAAVFPELGLKIEGTMDAISQGGFDEKAPWSMGRVGFYDGAIGPVGMVHSALSKIARETGLTGLIDDALLAKYPKTLSPMAVDYRRVEMDYQTREDGIAVRALDMILEHAELTGEGLIEPDRTFAGWGVMTLGAELTSDLIALAPALDGLPGSDDRLRIPVKLQGGPAGATIIVDERFIDECRKAVRGESVSAFVATEPQSELVMDMPTLREQFGRW